MLHKLQSMFQRTTTETKVSFIEAQRLVMTRGVGFCKTEGCEKFNQGVFIYSHDLKPGHFCNTCKCSGYVVKEEYSVKMTGDMTFWQVRVEFEYRPSLVANTTAGKYHGLAVVSDTSMSQDHNIYTLKSPLIATEKRALTVATTTLGGLLQNPVRMLEANLGAKPQESIIDFDKPLGEVRAQLWELEEQLRNSRLTKEFGL